MQYLHVVLRYDPQEVDVVVRVEAGHVLAADGLRPKHLHLAVQTVVYHQVVGHANTMRFHGVTLTVVVIPDLGCQKRTCDMRREAVSVRESNEHYYSGEHSRLMLRTNMAVVDV